MEKPFLTIACAGIAAAVAGSFFDGSRNESMARYIRFAFALCIICVTVFPLLRFIRSPCLPELSLTDFSEENFDELQYRYDEYVIEQTRISLIDRLSARITEKTGIMPRSVDIQFTENRTEEETIVTIRSVDIVTDCPSDTLADDVKEWIGVYTTLHTPVTEEGA